MGKIAGTYTVDIENSAKLQAGFFHERFEMKPGYDEAVQKYMRDTAHLVSGLSISIDPSRLVIKSPDGEDEFPILELDETSSPAQLVVDFDGKTTFKIIEVAPGSIHLQNPNNELGQCIWRRTGE